MSEIKSKQNNFKKKWKKKEMGSCTLYYSKMENQGPTV